MSSTSPSYKQLFHLLTPFDLLSFDFLRDDLFLRKRRKRWERRERRKSRVSFSHLARISYLTETTCAAGGHWAAALVKFAKTMQIANSSNKNSQIAACSVQLHRCWNFYPPLLLFLRMNSVLSFIYIYVCSRVIKKQKLSRQQDFSRKNFPDKARKSRHRRIRDNFA